jgi:hypothetical protein
MTLEQAKKIAGNQPRYALRNMHKALNMARWLNTAEEEERLRAACILLNKKYKVRL